MLSLRKPSVVSIRDFIARQRGLPFSYPEVGATDRFPLSSNGSKGMPGYDVDHNRVKLGQGRETFAVACAALRSWRMYELGWVTVCERVPIEAGAVVAGLARAYGLWALFACRIVYVIESASRIERYGFAYGTLTGHFEAGEERFSVEYSHDDESVWYDILAFSRPDRWISRAGYPLVRRVQKRFAADSKTAMVRAVGT